MEYCPGVNSLGEYMGIVCGRIFQEGINFAWGNCMEWMSISPCRITGLLSLTVMI